MTRVDKLVLGNRGLVFHHARYYSSYAPFEDLVGEGNIGLVVAAQRFDPSFGVKFSTYATYWIRHYIRKFAMMQGGRRAISIGRSRAHMRILSNYGRLRAQLEAKDGTVDLKKLARALKVTLPQLLEAIPLMTGPAEFEEAGMHDVSQRPTPEEEYAELEEESERRARFERAMGTLDARESAVIRARMRGETLQKIGKKLKLSRERIRQIENLAKDKLRLRCAGVAAA